MLWGYAKTHRSTLNLSGLQFGRARDISGNFVSRDSLTFQAVPRLFIKVAARTWDGFSGLIQLSHADIDRWRISAFRECRKAAVGHHRENPESARPTRITHAAVRSRTLSPCARIAKAWGV